MQSTPPRERRRGRRVRNRRNQRPHRSSNSHTTGDDHSQPSRESRSNNRPGRNRNRHTTTGSRTPRGNTRRRQPARHTTTSRGNTRSLTREDPQQLRLPTVAETSAGGLVLSGLAEAVGPNGEVNMDKIYVALIGRLDRRGRLLWSMPKGHVENNDSLRATAEREVWEETGLTATIIDTLGVIDYWFVSGGKRIHKTVHHHLLRYVDGDFNDEDPEVTEVGWFPASQLAEKLTYADERYLAHRAEELLPDCARREKAAGRVTPR
nr:NUDIX hydrolase [Corynebacterium choanae]